MATPQVQLLGLSLLAGFGACFSNGFLYAYSASSPVLSGTLGLTQGGVVVLGVLSQAGLGAFQLPVSMLLRYAKARGTPEDRLDRCVVLTCAAMYGAALASIAGVLYAAESSAQPWSTPSTSPLFAGLAVCFLLWGAAVGLTFQHVTTVAVSNLQTVSVGYRRMFLAGLSFGVALGGVVFVAVYQTLLRGYPLSSAYFGLAAWYSASSCLQLAALRRVRPKSLQPVATVARVDSADLLPREPDDVEVSLPAPAPAPDAPVRAAAEASVSSAPPTPSTSMASLSTSTSAATTARAPAGGGGGVAVVADASLSLASLARSPIAVETMLGGFFGVGVSGTFLASLGNLLTPQDTFGLTMTFLGAQALSRLTNAVLYAYNDWSFLFLVWQVLNVLGVVVAAANADSESAIYTGAALCGLAFGGCHSSFPVLCAVAYPGSAADYARNFGLTMVWVSAGSVIIGELTSVVLSDTDNDHLLEFALFIALSSLSSAVTLDLGRRLLGKKRRRALERQVEQAREQPSQRALAAAE